METAYENAQLALARITLADSNSLRKALRNVCESTAATMDIARISIWLFLPDGNSMRCEYLYQPDDPNAFEGTLLHRSQFPCYFRALEIQRAVPIADMSAPGILDEFLTTYMSPLSITAMLDAPIYRAGRIIGVVCHEQVKTIRPWNHEDELLAAYTADTVSRLYEEAARSQAELMLSTHQAHASELERIASMGKMAAAVAHDFKNILHGVLAYADLIAMADIENTRIQALVSKQIETVELGAKLAQDLLSLGKHDTEPPKVLDTTAAIRDHLPVLQSAAGYKAAIQLDFPQAICQVFINEQQFQRVLFNLVVNARDAIIDRGNIAIQVTEERRQLHTGDNGLYVTIAVRDDGKGMDENTLNQLFQPYFTTKGDEGTGLGMAIAQQIISLAGGFIDVTSTPGEGSCIKVRLPRIGNTAHSPIRSSS